MSHMPSLLLLFLLVGQLGLSQSNEAPFTLNHQGQKVLPASVLSEFVQISSQSGHEKPAGEYIREIARENGLFITQMGDQDGNFNFAASIYPLSSQKPNIILLGHLDVVSEGEPGLWTHPPFSGKVVGGDLWGRGAFDNKGALVMQLCAVVEMARIRAEQGATFSHNMSLLAVSCEETQCEGGAAFVVKNYLDSLNPSVVIGEGPPSISGIISHDPERPIFGISTAHKHPLWLKLSLEVQSSGHGSVTPPTYANQQMVIALSRLLEKRQAAIYTRDNCHVLRQLGELEKGIKALALKNPRFFRLLLTPQLRKQPELFALFSNSITLTGINNYEQVINVIPHEVNAYLDCRLIPGQSASEFLSHIKKKLDNEAIHIEVLHEGPDMVPSSESSPYYLHLKGAIENFYPQASVVSVVMPNFNDTGAFRAKGIAAYASIPIMIDRSYLEYIHTYNERIPLHALRQGREVYVNFLQRCKDIDP